LAPSIKQSSFLAPLLGNKEEESPSSTGRRHSLVTVFYQRIKAISDEL
jgi:hypothetical protein